MNNTIIKKRGNPKSKKRVLSWVLIFAFLLSSIPMESFAAIQPIYVEEFNFIQETEGGQTRNKVVIQGGNFRQTIGTQQIEVVTDVQLGYSGNIVDIGEIRAAGGSVQIANNRIEILAPRLQDIPNSNPKKNLLATAGVNTNGTTTIIISAREQNNIRFQPTVNNLPSLSGDFEDSSLYVGQTVEIMGTNFTGTTDFIIAGASHESPGELNVAPTKLTIPELKKGSTLGAPAHIQIVKAGTVEVFRARPGETPNQIKENDIDITFAVEYRNRITIYEKLAGMDNLLVLPSEGPSSIPSLITVYAMNEDGTVRLENIFRDKMEIYLRHPKSQPGPGIDKEIKLQDVELVTENGKTVGISGYTSLVGRKEENIEYHLIVKDPINFPLSEGIKRDAYKFVSAQSAPVITGLQPDRGPNTGGTNVTIVGRNIIHVETPGIAKGNASIVAKPTTNKEGNDILVVDYDINAPTGEYAKYGEQNITGIKRKIKAEISRDTVANALEIKYDRPDTNDYGNYHYTRTIEDGLVVTTQNVGIGGPQVVRLKMETLITLENGTVVSIPEGTIYSSFTFIETEPMPVIGSVEPEYGYYYDVDSTVKPLMLRIKGSRFEVLKDPVTGIQSFPDVKFKLPNGQALPVKILANTLTERDNIKVLKNGSRIDGEFETIGDTLVVCVVPDGDLKTYLMSNGIQDPDGYRYTYGIVEVTNPGGGRNGLSQDGVKFEFRHPEDTPGNTAAHARQPIISSVLLNGNVPVQKLSSDRENEVEIRFSTRAGLSDLSKIRVTIDGMDISSRIVSRQNDGNTAVIKVNIPRGISGKTRLQLIVNEGLMDSYDISFDNILGPEIKDITPDSGDSGTIAIIKRDTQANTIGFRPHLSESTNEQERRGTRVLINGEDINQMFGGYELDGDNKVIYQESDFFTNFTNPNEKLMLPGKYVYVVDADTIYVKFPEGIQPGRYVVQVKNPDGSESTSPKTFTVVDTVAKTKIETIDPGQDDENGGIITTITAGNGTNFKGEVDIFFGSQKAEVVGYNLDYTKVYVKVPPLRDFKFPENPSNTNQIESYTVPVTVINKINKSTDTKGDGFVYLNPNYTVKITKIYKEGMSSGAADANRVNSGDYIWIEGENFRGKTTDGSTVTDLPIVMFGYTKVVAEDYDIMNIGSERAELSRIKVKVPPKPINAAQDGSVDVLVQNYDGAKAIKQKGVIYGMGNPTIDEKTSILRARKTGERIEIYAKEIFQDGLIVAFGNRTYKKELGNRQQDFTTNEKGELEQIVVRYIPGGDVEIYYRNPSGELKLMEDATLLQGNSEVSTGGKISLGNDPGVTKIVGINWQNPDYHKSTNAASNPDTLKTYNKEYMSIKTTQEGSNNYIEIRRALGKVESFKRDSLNNSVIGINTPFHDKIENTTITLINSDGSSATAPFEFHGGLDAPQITDLEGSKARNVTIDGALRNVKVKTQDYTVDGTLKIIGKNFKDVQSVRIGTKDVKIESISPDYTYIIVSVPKGTPAEVGTPMQVTVVTKEGNSFSGRTEPPVYFMYIAADSKPIIETITPVQGPRTGGTLVKITGKGFRERDEFGVVSDKVEERITITVNGSLPAGLKSTVKNPQGEIVELQVLMPPSATGTAKLQVINADGGTSEPKDFKYISQPKISNVEGSVFFNDTETEIKLLGEDFQSGAKVIIGGELVKTKNPPENTKASGILGVTGDGINQDAHVTGGVEATGVTVTGVNQITFKMPPGIESLENTSIIIVNPDTGISDPGQGNVKPPIPDVPDIEAIPGFERSMILRWKVDKSVLNAAEKFEIYAREDGSGDYVFVGDTKGTEYIVRGLKENTRYQFKVRVLNKFGQANDVGYVTARTLSSSQDYKEQDKIKEVEKVVTQIETQGKQEVVGSALHYTVGTSENFINLGNFNQNEKYVQIPVRDIKRGGKTLTISERGMTLNIPYSSLNVSQISSASDDAFFRIKLTSVNNQMQESIGALVPRNMSRNSRVYAVDFEVVDRRTTAPVFNLSGSTSISITPDRGTSTNNTIYRYIEASHSLMPVGSGTIQLREAGHYLLLSPR